MNEQKELTPGQKAVVDAYLANYRPAEIYDDNSTILIDTETLMQDMATMCVFEEIPLSDYLVQKGFLAHFAAEDGISGWILQPINL